MSVTESRVRPLRRFVEDIRCALVKATRCDIQQNGWPCGTCTCFLLGQLMPENAPEYSEHNDPIDRINEVWRAILQIREHSSA